MQKIKIFTDSTSDLSKQLIMKEDIGVIPLYVTMEDVCYRDGIDLTVPQLYEKVEKIGKLPKTAAPSPQDYYEAFAPWVKEGYQVLYVGLSSKISSAIQNAKIATFEFEDDAIGVVDSYNLSSGIGLLVLKAADLRREGKSLNEIMQQLEVLVPKVRTAFIIDTLDYLYMGGRCSALANFFGGMLKIRPVVTVKDGGMILKEKLRGKRERALSKMLEDVISEKGHMDRARIMVTHSLSDEDAHYLKAAIEAEGLADEVLITDAGCVISSHCGENTVGILYIED